MRLVLLDLRPLLEMILEVRCLRLQALLDLG